MTESKTTFKTLIEKKYNELMKDISNVIELDDELFPKLDDEICWAELFKYIEFVFPDDNTGYNIEELFDFKGLLIVFKINYHPQQHHQNQKHHHLDLLLGPLAHIEGSISTSLAVDARAVLG
jgi:hypothetical protein